MRRKKRVGPRMEPGGTPEEHLEETQICNSIELVCKTLSKSLDISRAAVLVAPDLLKALAILSDTTVKRSAID